MINKKIFKVSYIVFYFIFMILFFPSITNAENKYFFTKEELDGTKIEGGKIGAGSGFDTKAECDTYVKSVHSSLKPSTCYAGGNVTITSVSPSSGKIGDLITIKGTNLNDVVSVSFNGRDAGYSNPKMTSQIKPSIPSGATSGVITVKTRYRGTATYKNFIISKQDDLYWWYLNNSNEYYGASGRLSTPGFTNEADCNKDRLEYEASSSQAKTTGPCFQETETTILKDRSNLYPIEAVKKKSTDTTTYNLLAPIGELKSVSSMNISDYFSLMLKIIIGLCAVSAVVMIVIGGVQYMGKDSIFGKAEAKGRIINAIFGLIIALGSYALLNTINPDLLGVKGLNIKQVEGVIDLEYENEPWEGSSFGNNKNLCPQGFYNIDVPWGVGNKKTLNVCSSIKKDVIDLLNAAKSKGIMLSGSGSRTTEEQQDLRIQHGCPDSKTPSSKCNPPTARPGHSMHETGMAIDFRCNNVKMRSGDDCFNWLKDNAYKYKLYNLKSEPWHWSTNGK